MKNENVKEFEELLKNATNEKVSAFYELLFNTSADFRAFVENSKSNTNNQ